MTHRHVFVRALASMALASAMGGCASKTTPAVAPAGDPARAPASSDEQAAKRSLHDLLIGGWGPTQGQNFVYLFERERMLDEMSMAWAPYTLEGTTLRIQNAEAEPFVYEIEKLTETELVVTTPSGARQTFVRLTTAP